MALRIFEVVLKIIEKVGLVALIVIAIPFFTFLWFFLPAFFWIFFILGLLGLLGLFDGKIAETFTLGRLNHTPFKFTFNNVQYESKFMFTQKSIVYGYEEILPHNGRFCFIKFYASNAGREVITLPSNVEVANLVEKYPLLEWSVIEDLNPEVPPSETTSRVGRLIESALESLDDSPPQPVPDESNHIKPGKSKIVQARFDVPAQAIKPGSGYVLRFGDVTVYRF